MAVHSCPVNPADVKKALDWLNAIKPKGLVSELRFNAGIRSDAAKRRGLKKLASPPASVQIVRDIKLLLSLFDAKAKFQEKVQAGINSLAQEINLADAKLLHDEAKKVWGLDLKLPEIDAEKALQSTGEIKSKDDLKRVVMLASLMRFKTDPYQYSESQKFIEDFGSDSLDTVEFIMSLEEKLGIEVPDEEAEKLVSPQATIDYLLDLPKFSGLK